MKKTLADYARLTEIAAHCGLVPHKYSDGKIKEGFYTMEGLHAPVDLSACAEDEKSILKTALKQLSEMADDSYHAGIEHNLAN